MRRASFRSLLRTAPTHAIAITAFMALRRSGATATVDRRGRVGLAAGVTLAVCRWPARAAAGAGTTPHEHGADEVGAGHQLVDRAREADLALLHEHGPLGNGQRHVERLLDQDHGRALGVDR